MAFSRIVMVLALRCFPPQRSDWARALYNEFEITVEDGRSFAFAIGCVAIACRERFFHDGGRFLLARYGLALCAIVPVATFHLGCAVSGFRFVVRGTDHYYGFLAAGDDHQRVIAAIYKAAAPLTTLLLLLLGIGHLLIAWNIVACRWRRVAVLWSMVAAVVAGLVGLIAITAPGPMAIAVQTFALALEMVLIPALVFWQRALAGPVPPISKDCR